MDADVVAVPVAAVGVVDGDGVGALFGEHGSQPVRYLGDRGSAEGSRRRGDGRVHAGVAIAELHDSRDPERGGCGLELRRPRRPQISLLGAGQAKLAGGRRDDNNSMALGAATRQGTASEQRFVVRMSVQGH